MKRKRSPGSYAVTAGLALVVIFMSVMIYRSMRPEEPDGVLAGHIAKRLVRGEKIDFLSPQPIGFPFRVAPKISNVQVIDLDQDGMRDVLVCDCQSNFVSCIRQEPPGKFTERILADQLIAPAHVQAIDVDGDGDLDLAVAVLGKLLPTNQRVGSVVLLENVGGMQFEQHVILDGVARVSDVRGGDLDGDGDIDLAVAQFGYDDGETRWLENRGSWEFRSHLLQRLPGAIHCEIADFNQDGNPDLALLVSQESEEIYVFAGDGTGGFAARRVLSSANTDFGSSGMWVYDLDQDGDADILYTNGDGFDRLAAEPQPWHGIQWLENLGDHRFRYRRIADFGGAVGARPVDVDQDGDLDLLVASAFNDWKDPRSQSLVWLENVGQMQFRWHDLTNTPSHLQALDVGDLDGDGQVDVITGGMHVYEPYDRVERVVLWRNRWRAAAASGD